MNLLEKLLSTVYFKNVRFPCVTPYIMKVYNGAERAQCCCVVAWTGRGGTTIWPPRSPDLTPLDVSVWGYVKDTKFFFFPLFLQVWKNYGRG